MVKSAFAVTGKGGASKCLVVFWTEEVYKWSLFVWSDGARKEGDRDVLGWILSKREMDTHGKCASWIWVAVQAVYHDHEEDNSDE